MHRKRKKRSKVEIDAIKNKITNVWGKIYYKPMSTEAFFKAIGYDYNNIKDRENIYRYNRECQEKAEEIFDNIIEADKDKRFKDWMDYCWLHKIPYILLKDGIACTPRNYLEWQEILEKITIRAIFGVRKTMVRMISKDMELLGVPLCDLLPIYEEFVNLLPEDIEEEE